MQLIYIIFFNNHTFCFYSLFVCLLIIPFFHHNNQLFFCILLWSIVNIQKQYNYHPTFTFFFLISLFRLLNLTVLIIIKVCLHKIYLIIKNIRNKYLFIYINKIYLALSCLVRRTCFVTEPVRNPLTCKQTPWQPTEPVPWQRADPSRILELPRSQLWPKSLRRTPTSLNRINKLLIRTNKVFNIIYLLNLFWINSKVFIYL